MYHFHFPDQEPPVFTYCPKDISIDDITNTVIRVNWDRPLAKDNSGAPSIIQCNRVSGEEYSVPGSYQVFCEAKDQAGNKAECSFQLVLKSKYTGVLLLIKRLFRLKGILQDILSEDFETSPAVAAQWNGLQDSSWKPLR